MPTLTRLSPTEDRPVRVMIEVDGEPFAAVPAWVAKKAGLAEGEEWEPAALVERLEQAELECAMERTLQLLSYRARTRDEVRRRLRREGYSGARIEPVLDRLGETGLVDDEAFAAAFVRGRLNAHPEGIRLMADALSRRGIARELAVEVIRRVLEDEGISELDLLARAAERRLRSLSRLSRAVARRRLFDSLARRGFPLEEVRAVIDRLLPS